MRKRQLLSWGHNYIGTSHLLFGLLDEEGIGCEILKTVGAKNSSYRNGQLYRSMCMNLKRGPETKPAIEYSPRALKALTYTECEANDMNMSGINTGHLLLGLLREQDGVAAQILMNPGFRLDTVREAVRVYKES